MFSWISSPTVSLARAVALTAAIATTAATAGCYHSEDANTATFKHNSTIRISALDDDVENRVWAELYRSILEKSGREVTVDYVADATHASQWEDLTSQKTDFIITCMGEMLAELNPPEANDIATDFRQAELDPNAGDFIERTHSELMGSLPATVSTNAPSSATGCDDSDEDLPQDYVPLFDSTLFDRSELATVQSLTQFVTDKDLDELIQQVDQGRSEREAAKAWVSTDSSADSVEEDPDSDDSSGIG